MAERRVWEVVEVYKDAGISRVKRRDLCWTSNTWTPPRPPASCCTR